MNIQTTIEKRIINIEKELARSWWVFALSGLASVLFGMAALVLPLDTLRALMYAFGAFALIDGGFALVASIFAAKARAPWWPLALVGITGIIAGILTLVWPEVTALVLLYVIAFWAIISGGFLIVAALRLHKLISREWLLVLGGTLSVLFGLLLVAFPGAVAIVTLIGAFQFALGVVTMAFSLDLFLLNRRGQYTTTRPNRDRAGTADLASTGGHGIPNAAVSAARQEASRGDMVGVIRNSHHVEGERAGVAGD